MTRMGERYGRGKTWLRSSRDGACKGGTWQLEGSWHANTLAMCMPVVEKSVFRIAMGDARVTSGCVMVLDKRKGSSDATCQRGWAIIIIKT